MSVYRGGTVARREEAKKVRWGEETGKEGEQQGKTVSAYAGSRKSELEYSRLVSKVDLSEGKEGEREGNFTLTFSKFRWMTIFETSHSTSLLDSQIVQYDATCIRRSTLVSLSLLKSRSCTAKLNF